MPLTLFYCVCVCVCMCVVMCVCECVCLFILGVFCPSTTSPLKAVGVAWRGLTFKCSSTCAVSEASSVGQCCEGLPRDTPTQGHIKPRDTHSAEGQECDTKAVFREHKHYPGRVILLLQVPGDGVWCLEPNKCLPGARVCVCVCVCVCACVCAQRH